MSRSAPDIYRGLDRLLPGLEHCYAQSQLPSSYEKPHVVSITFALDENSAPYGFATVADDPLAVCTLAVVQQEITTARDVGPARAQMTINVSFFDHRTWPALAERRPRAKKAYPSLRAVLAGDYRASPAAGVSRSLGGYFNPATGNRLHLDLSAGGGHACCEQPTFYAWLDPAEGLVWIETYQASVGSVDDHWYGPFAL